MQKVLQKLGCTYDGNGKWQLNNIDRGVSVKVNEHMNRAVVAFNGEDSVIVNGTEKVLSTLNRFV